MFYCFRDDVFYVKRISVDSLWDGVECVFYFVGGIYVSQLVFKLALHGRALMYAACVVYGDSMNDF